MLLCPVWEKSKYLYHVSLLQKEHFCSGIQATEPQCKQLLLTEHMADEHFHRHSYKWGIGGKNASIAFQRKPPWGLVFFHLVEHTLQVGSLKPLVLCLFWDFYEALFALTSLCSAFSFFVTKAPFLTYHSSPERRPWEWISSYRSPLQTPSAQRPFCRGLFHWPNWKRIQDSKKERVPFYWKPPLGAGVLSLSGINIANWKIQASCLMFILRLLQGADCPIITQCCLSA